MKALGRLWNAVGRHKYTITIVGFLLIICFLDQNNLMQRWQHRQQRLSLQKEILMKFSLKPLL